MYRVLFNPLSKSGRNKKIIDHILDILRNMNEEYDLLSIIDIKNFNNYLDEIPLSDKILIVGGDGTIHYLVNFLDGKEIKHEIYFYGAGTGNDFVRNIESKDEFVLINGYLNNLPIAYFEGIERRFVNGKKAYELFLKYNKQEATLLPSTSSANASYSFDRLLEHWCVIKY